MKALAQLKTRRCLFNGHFPGQSDAAEAQVQLLNPASLQSYNQYQNVSTLDFIGAKYDGHGGDNCSYKTCKAPVKSSTPEHTNIPTFLQAGCSLCRPINSVVALRGVLSSRHVMWTKSVSLHNLCKWVWRRLQYHYQLQIASGQIVKSEQGERFPSLHPPLPPFSFSLTPSFPSLSPSLPSP